jgi:Domain of unknown function (DUF4177)
MAQYEYKVVPAPVRGEKIRGAKTTEDRFAATLAEAMNTLGREGWEYVRADTLPCEERVGFTGRKTTYLNMLVFRRMIAEAAIGMAPVSGMGAMPLSPPAPPVPAAPRVDWPMSDAAPSLGPARPLAAE